MEDQWPPMIHESWSTHLSPATYPSVASSKPVESTDSRDRPSVINPMAMAEPVTAMITTMSLSSQVVAERDDAVLSITL